MLDVRRLRYFLAVAEDLHFGHAADRLHVAQSALSTQIAGLERDLGVRLLNRAKRSAVTLTDAGKRFRVEALAALRQLERADRIGRQLGRGEIGDVDVGYVISAALCGLAPRALRRLREVHPAVNVRLVPMQTPSQLAALQDGSIDAGFMRPRRSYPAGIVARVVHEEPMMLAMAASHALAAQPTLTPADLVGHEFITPQFDEPEGFGDLLGMLGRSAGGDIEPAIRVGDFLTALGLAAGGYGVVLVPSSSANLEFGNLVYRRITGFEEVAKLVVAWRASDQSPATASLIDAVPPLGTWSS